jgi:hypothetical protein
MQLRIDSALLLFGLAALAVMAGIALAVAHYPGGYDWAYTVISRLASPRHNPAGGVWLSASLIVALALLWPVVRALAGDGAASSRTARFAIGALRVGVVAGVLLGLEGLLGADLRQIGRKAHETLALVALVSFYTGVLALYADRLRAARAAALPALLVMVPLIAIGASQLALYFDQRELGWVNVAWRELGVPVWLSFAFWQWLAVAFLGLGFGWLVATRATNARVAPVAAAAVARPAVSPTE